MSVLTVVLTLVMLLSAVGFVVGGLVLAEGILRRPTTMEGTPPISRTRRIGAIFLFVVGCLLVVTAIVTGVLVAEREAHFLGLQATVSRLEARLQAIEGKLGQDVSGQRRPSGQSQ